MSNFSLNINNYNHEDIDSALSLHSLSVKFENDKDAHAYESGVGTIRASVMIHIKRMKEKYIDQIECLTTESKNEFTSDERQSEITFIKRCVKYGKQFKRGYKNSVKFSSNFNRIINQLFQSYKLNKMVWVNKNKTFYNYKNLNRYFEHIFDCDAMCLIFDMLESLKYIDGIGFKKGTKYTTGQASRFIVNEKLSQLFDSITGNVEFVPEEYKDVVILKNELKRWKTVKVKGTSEIKHIRITKKYYLNYEDNDFTNKRRAFIKKINKFYDSKKIEVSARNILLKKSFIPILYNWIISKRILLKNLFIERIDNDEKNMKMIGGLIDCNNNVRMCIREQCKLVENHCKYKSILSQKMPILKDLDYYLVDDEYVFVKEIEFEVLDKSIRSIFNRGSFEKGGRFYGSVITEMPETLRKAILIDGEPVLSCDYKAYHIVLSYHISGAECPFSDPYDIAGTDREEIKLASLVSINAPDLDSAVYATKNKINNKLSKNITEEDAECLLMKFIEKHPKLIDNVASDYGVSLQFYDSVILMDALEALMDSGICGLGVHDEIIAPAKYIDKTVETMKQSYEKQPFTHGFKPIVTVDKDTTEVPYLAARCDFSESSMSDEGKLKNAA